MSAPGLKKEEEQRLKDEMKRMQYEPLLPVEKKLIAMSIGLGIVLLFVFIWMSHTFFPGAGVTH
jgi:hypothetical protein